MGALLELKKSELEEWKTQWKELSKGLMNAGIANQGDYRNNMDKAEIEIEKLEKAIQALENEEKTKNSNQQISETPNLFVFVISGTNVRIKNAIKDDEVYQYYSSMKPLNHDDKDLCGWKPFS